MFGCPLQKRTPGLLSRRRHDERRRKGGLRVSLRLDIVAKHSHTSLRVLGRLRSPCPVHCRSATLRDCPSLDRRCESHQGLVLASALRLVSFASHAEFHHMVFS
jgi:hypothetical protein